MDRNDRILEQQEEQSEKYIRTLNALRSSMNSARTRQDLSGVTHTVIASVANLAEASPGPLTEEFSSIANDRSHYGLFRRALCKIMTTTVKDLFPYVLSGVLSIPNLILTVFKKIFGLLRNPIACQFIVGLILIGGLVFAVVFVLHSLEQIKEAASQYIGVAAIACSNVLDVMKLCFSNSYEFLKNPWAGKETTNTGQQNTQGVIVTWGAGNNDSAPTWEAFTCGEKGSSITVSRMGDIILCPVSKTQTMQIVHKGNILHEVPQDAIPFIYEFLQELSDSNTIKKIFIAPTEILSNLVSERVPAISQLDIQKYVETITQFPEALYWEICGKKALEYIEWMSSMLMHAAGGLEQAALRKQVETKLAEDPNACVYEKHDFLLFLMEQMTSPALSVRGRKTLPSWISNMPVYGYQQQSRDYPGLKIKNLRSKEMEEYEDMSATLQNALTNRNENWINIVHRYANSTNATHAEFNSMLELALANPRLQSKIHNLVHQMDEASNFVFREQISLGLYIKIMDYIMPSWRMTLTHTNFLNLIFRKTALSFDTELFKQQQPKFNVETQVKIATLFVGSVFTQEQITRATSRDTGIPTFINRIQNYVAKYWNKRELAEYLIASNPLMAKSPIEWPSGPYRRLAAELSDVERTLKSKKATLTNQIVTIGKTKDSMAEYDELDENLKMIGTIVQKFQTVGERISLTSDQALWLFDQGYVSDPPLAITVWKGNMPYTAQLSSEAQALERATHAANSQILFGQYSFVGNYLVKELQKRSAQQSKTTQAINPSLPRAAQQVPQIEHESRSAPPPVFSRTNTLSRKRQRDDSFGSTEQPGYDLLLFDLLGTHRF